MTRGGGSAILVAMNSTARSATDRWAWRLATVLGLSERVVAPGTLAGSLPAVLLWLGLAMVARPPLLAAATAALAVAAAAAGTWAGEVEAARRGDGDPGPVVIDEVAGQWLTLAVAGPWLPVDPPGGLAGVAGAAFVLFRLFDVVKPWPVSRLERLPGGFGIMADDLGAGILAGACLAALATWLV